MKTVADLIKPRKKFTPTEGQKNQRPKQPYNGDRVKPTKPNLINGEVPLQNFLDDKKGKLAKERRSI